MRHRLLSPLLSGLLGLVLLLTQQLGAVHLLSHGPQAAAHGAAASADAHGAAAADAGHDAADALCQLCLALATLAALALPALCSWWLAPARAGAKRPTSAAPGARLAAAPYRARGPPEPALN